MTLPRLFAACLATACATKVSPASIYPSPPPPPMEPPELAPPPRAPDDAAAAAPYLPGSPPPYTDPGTCLVMVRGVVLPEAKTVELYQAAELGVWWKARALDCADFRATDRAYADQVAARQALELEAAQADARWLRWALPVAMAAGVALGVTSAELGGRSGAR